MNENEFKEMLKKHLKENMRVYVRINREDGDAKVKVSIDFDGEEIDFDYDYV